MSGQSNSSFFPKFGHFIPNVGPTVEKERERGGDGRTNRQTDRQTMIDEETNPDPKRLPLQGDRCTYIRSVP